MNSYDIILEFERLIAEYAGSKYAVSVSSGTNAIFLSFLYLKHINEIKNGDTVVVPSKTFLSVPMTVKNAGLNVKFKDIKWSGYYQLSPTRIYDSAVRFKKDMYIKDSLYILSFQYRKHIPIGRGGMVLLNDYDAAEYLRQLRFNGKHANISRWEDKFEVIGWDMYMTPEQAARGIQLFYNIKNDNPDMGGYYSYPDLSNQKVFKNYE